MKKLICVVGLPGSGKSTALEFAKPFGAVVVMGDVVRDEAIKKGLKITPESLGRIAKELRQKAGADIIAERTILKIHNLEEGIVFVDGLRSLHELELFRQNFPKVVLVSIDAPTNLRYTRLKDRKRADDPQSMPDLKIRDTREIDFGLKDVMDLAEFQIANNNSVEHLKSECEDLFFQLCTPNGNMNDDTE
jgi:dephospho-CoA kinase